jgi:hypothetical protein
MSKIGRNEPCSCGSGKKFKRCHGAQPANSRHSKMLLIIVGGAVLAALAAVVTLVTTDRGGGSTRVWDPAHGHYHNEYGREIP